MADTVSNTDLRARRKESIEQARTIHETAKTESRGMTAAEKEQFDAHMAEAKRLEGVLEDEARAKQAEIELEAATRYDVPPVATGTTVAPEQRASETPRQIEIRENPSLAYRKGDGLTAILHSRMMFEPHQHHTAVREAERLYGSGSPHVRALQQTSFTAGGALIPENFVGSEFIEALRAQAAFRRAGPRMVALVNGSFTTPRLTGSTTVSYIGSEGDNLATSEPTFGQLKLVEKKVGVVVPFSNDLRRNASLDAIRTVTQDLIQTVALDEDEKCFNGSGLAGLPKGIYNWIPSTQKANQTGTSLANFRTDVRKMKNGLDSNNVPYINRAFFMHSRSMNYAGWDLTDGNGNFSFPSLQMANGASLGGDAVYRANALSITGGGGTESQIFYVEMNECYLAESMDLEIEIFSNATYDLSGTLRSGISRDESVLRLIRKWDFGMRHTVSAFIIEQVTLGA